MEITLSYDVVTRLILAILVGGAVGLERELHRKSAGFRTIMLICVGSCLFTMISVKMTTGGQVAANVITGVGFIGAGVILHENTRIKGLTTAASIWVSAAYGMGIGIGSSLVVVLLALVVLVGLFGFARFETWLLSIRDLREYTITLSDDLDKVEHIKEQITACDLHKRAGSQVKRNGQLVLEWSVLGRSGQQDCFVQEMLKDPEIKGIEW